MYYEEAIINNKLHFRTHPHGDWKIANQQKHTAAVNKLAALSADDRSKAMKFFCFSCGTIQPRTGMSCQCWNDE